LRLEQNLKFSCLEQRESIQIDKMSEILSFEVNDHFFVSVKMINMMIGTKFESQSKILSGFRMPFGSRVCLMSRITFTVSGPNSKGKYFYVENLNRNEFHSLNSDKIKSFMITGLM
jgi:hypothetical protein